MNWLDTREIFGKLSASTSRAFETRLMDGLCLCLAASLRIPVDVTAKHIHARRYRDHTTSAKSRSGSASTCRALPLAGRDN